MVVGNSPGYRQRMHSTMIIVNIIMSALAVGAIALIMLFALRLRHGCPVPWGRANWRGPAAHPIT
jgi:hypothetical protein